MEELSTYASKFIDWAVAPESDLEKKPRSMNVA